VFLVIGLGWALIMWGVAVAAIAAFGVETRPREDGKRAARGPWVPQAPQVPHPRDKAAS
jgi:hypothetical protein